MHSVFSVVLPGVLNHVPGAFFTLFFTGHHSLQKFLVILGPLPDRYLCYLDCLFIPFLNNSRNFKLALFATFGDRSFEALVPRKNLRHLLTSKHLSDVVDQITWIVVRDEGSPSHTDAISTVDKSRWK